MTPKQIKMIRFLLAKCGVNEEHDKEDLVYEYTDGRTASLSDMRHRETVALVNALNARLNPDKLKRDKQVGKILSLAHEMHWELKSGKVDMARVDNFCLTQTKQKKTLKEFTDAELPKLVTLFEKVYISFLKGL